MLYVGALEWVGSSKSPEGSQESGRRGNGSVQLQCCQVKIQPRPYYSRKKLSSVPHSLGQSLGWGLVDGKGQL